MGEETLAFSNSFVTLVATLKGSQERSKVPVKTGVKELLPLPVLPVSGPTGGKVLSGASPTTTPLWVTVQEGLLQAL